MNNKTSKIIAVIGPPASGKSTLIRSLNKKYKIRPFMEGEEKDLPNFIKNNIDRNIKGLQTILFFHNQYLRQYSEAIKLSHNGEIVLLDNFWLANLFYINIMLKDKEDKLMAEDLIVLTGKILPEPDIVLYLEIADKTIKERIKQRGRKFEKNFLTNALKINKEYYNFFNQKHFKKYLNTSKIIKINSDNHNLNKIGKILT